jgi:glycosyltransferase involved in cell wall biosynthesis
VAVAQNQRQAAGFTEVFNKPTVLIRNAVPGEVTPAGKDKSFVLWVGRNLDKKRPELFVELARKLPEYSFVMIMAPSIRRDDREYRDYSKSLPNFEYKGFLPFHEADAYFDQAKLLVSTSEREGFPNVFLQAWQALCPVVSLQVDPDQVIDRFDLGRVSRDFDEMVNHVRSLMDNDELRNRLARNGVNYINRYHSLSAVVDDYEALFARFQE